MTTPVQIIGSPISPYVRKVLVCLELKRLDYTIDPIVPFFGNDEFSRLSPLRRIPVQGGPAHGDELRRRDAAPRHHADLKSARTMFDTPGSPAQLSA